MYANDICKLEFMRDSDLMALKKKDLDKYLEDFLATKEQRMRNFEKFIRDSGNTSMVFDYTPESLVELWKWFRPFVKFVERTQKELDAEAAATPEKFRRFVYEEKNRKRISYDTECIIYDISVYWGEVFIKNHPGVRWGYITKPKSSFCARKIILVDVPKITTEVPYRKIHVCTWGCSRDLKEYGVWNDQKILETYNFSCELMEKGTWRPNNN